MRERSAVINPKQTGHLTFSRAQDVLMKLNLRTIHMMAAARPLTDRKKGRRFERFAEFGLELQELIVEWNRTRPSGPWDHPVPPPG
jgi:hypothetical protein